ncbi:beta-ketoacyl synthase N-terminal-like domain-containing protein [Schlesneria sp. DSM 10557]|uniref:beta-ketoacyl synthase N-terminal-like domain-containing protein n=1 Tax=Schlesneria sp. DSM 10557 TaxID=3044399 RepID=UPI0035A16E15
MPPTDRSERIAIVGVGGVFPGGSNLDKFWQNIADGVDTGRSVPPDRWFLDPAKAVDKEGPKPDRVYSDWGCFVEGFQFDPEGLRLDPALLRQLDPLFHLGLHAARAAFRDAREMGGTERSRVGVILGNIVLPTESTSALCRDVLGRTLFERIVEAAAVPDGRKNELKRGAAELVAAGNWHPLNRLAASLPAVLIAEGLGLGGPAYTLDAACASSLYALKFACEELLAGRADAMLAGGMSRPDCQYTQMGFAQLKALSRGGRCAPLSSAADGLVVGEGAGVFVLKRLTDAVSAGDHIYGVIAGIGLSNDRGANLLAPHSEGQLRAMRSAYEQAGWRPSDVDLIECHATGTPVGDGVEIDSLHQLWADETSSPGQCVIGGVKSNVGHLLTGAGAAGLMKVLYAFRHETLPPTANFQQPAAGLARSGSPFRVLSRAEPWPRRTADVRGTVGATTGITPRRATINAFGFGGINAHVLIEEYCGPHHSNMMTRVPVPASPAQRPNSTADRSLSPAQDLDIAIVGVASSRGLLATGGLPATQSNRSDSLASDDASERAKSPSDIRDWGVTHSDWFLNEFAGAAEESTAAVTSVELPMGEFRIPPLEMQDMLPQQQLMLKVAAAALKDADSVADRADRSPSDAIALGNATGVFVGIELDPNTTNFHFRWSIEELASHWATALNLELSDEELTQWTTELKDSVSPPLSANRVMGNLGGIVASRLAREFNVGGPSFTISADANSGLRACAVAAQSLRRGELDRAVVGAVDLVCDIRHRVAVLRERQQNGDGGNPAFVDSATAFILKRREDAVRDGDHIHAILSRIETDPGEIGQLFPDGSTHRGHAEPPADGRSPADGLTVESPAGAATGLLRLFTAVESLSRHAIPESPSGGWMQNRVEQTRPITLSGLGPDGRSIRLELTTAPGPVRKAALAQRAAARETRAALPVGLFVIDGDSVEQLESGVNQLNERAANASSVATLASDWFRSRPPQPEHRWGLSLVVRSLAEIPDVARIAVNALRDQPAAVLDRRVRFTRTPLGTTGRLSFVFPGSGNAFLGMGRELLNAFPEVLHQQYLENERLRDQYRPDLIWFGDSTAAVLEQHKAMIFGQVALGTAVCDLLNRLGVTPDASIGYSLGESAALFGLRAWTDRDEMLRRMEQATLFGSDLVTPFEAARRAWNVPAGSPVRWTSGVIDRSAAVVQAAIQNLSHDQGRPGSSTADASGARVYLLIVNTPQQCVIGGETDGVERLVRDLGGTFVPFAAPSTVHCPILRQVEEAYRALHLMQTTVPLVKRPRIGTAHYEQPIDFYSTAWGRKYELSRESAAEAIVAQAVNTIDFPRVVEQAYSDGVRLFVEIGPGSSCTRMIDEILSDRPHRALSATPSTASPLVAFYELLAVLIAERIPVELRFLYGDARTTEATITSPSPTKRGIVTAVGGSPFLVPRPAKGWRIPPRASTFGMNVMTQFDDMVAARLRAHETYLRVTAEAQRIMAEQLALFTRIAAGEQVASPDLVAGPTVSDPVEPVEPVAPNAAPPVEELPPTPLVAPRSLNRAQCMEYAIGKIGRVLGPQFAPIDEFPTRVRLPDEPLMLADRMLEIEGEPLSMTSGRVVTEHDIHEGAWYLDCNRIPTCIAVEAGQADLFLSGWLGIDFQTKGLASYRLLDAVVTFHQELPGPGKTINYNIRILHFFRQGQTYLFRFEFDATVDGEPLLTMREGCAGFFTAAELNSGKGIIHTALDKQARPGKWTGNWKELVPLARESFSDAQLLALRRGDLAACFGAQFAQLPLTNPVTIPGLTRSGSAGADERSKMWLVDRILQIEPTGGKFGMGTILGELDIHPDDWFLTCHFCDDQVMPGTLMYECCMHTLRILLLRMGWLGEADQIVYEPIPGVRSRLKCRGQVLATTKKVWYEITLKEVGYRDFDAASGAPGVPSESSSPTATPYCLADALMYADGKPIVEITDMSVRMSGLTREFIERLWSSAAARGEKGVVISSQKFTPRYDRRPALFDTDRITAFAVGKPSEAFGDRYQVFDAERVIARLPGPPFQFLDRIVAISDCEQWVLNPGGVVVAQYDVPPDEWYFQSNRQRRMPFAVLLETALQPCGWLAAYVGSALTSDTDISFRNLGGTATQYRDVTPASGTLTTTVKMTRVSNAGGMIIQHYDFDLRCDDQPVYVGNTYFGFFSRASLLNQVGIREAKPFSPSPDEASQAERFAYQDRAPFADSQFQMIDNVQISLQNGPYGQGFAIGTTRVNPESWFFKAHFYQDPVVPGSLGLESFFQLLKFYAARRWNAGPDAQFLTPVLHDPASGTSGKHEWVYRGQVVPRDQLVTVTAVIKSVDDQRKTLIAEGFLSVDGRVIYQMKEFSLGLE